MRSHYKKIGDYIQLVDTRNKDLSVNTLLGLTINKEFIPSVANTVGTNMANYKIIRKGQFACSLMQVRRDKKIPVALLRDFDEAIISQAYPVFEIIDTEKLLPEYLMMWMSRSEFDREACFYAVGGVRGSLEWDDFCEMTLPVPSIEKQREIVKEYQTIVRRIELNEALNRKLEETAQAIYKQWFVDFEFPISADYAASMGKLGLEGRPYKSSGGEMVNNEELDRDIPRGWNNGQLFDILELQRDFDLPTHKREKGTCPVYAASGLADFHSEFKVSGPCVITGRSGSIGDVFYVRQDFWPLNTTLWVKDFKNSTPLFAYFTLKSINLTDYNGGSAVPTLNRNHVHMLDMCIPSMKTIIEFEKKCRTLFDHKDC